MSDYLLHTVSIRIKSGDNARYLVASYDEDQGIYVVTTTTDVNQASHWHFERPVSQVLHNFVTSGSDHVLYTIVNGVNLYMTYSPTDTTTPDDDYTQLFLRETGYGTIHTACQLRVLDVSLSEADKFTRWGDTTTALEVGDGTNYHIMFNHPHSRRPHGLTSTGGQSSDGANFAEWRIEYV